MNIPAHVEIPNFPADKRFAVTLSFDDGTSYDRHVVAALNAWGMKGTFNLNSGLLQRSGKPILPGRPHLDASEIADLFKGHEVAIHTVNHPSLEKLEPSQVVLEVLEDRKALEDLVGYPVRGMAYPGGAFSTKVIEVIRALGIVYCRTAQNALPCFPPAEPLAWAPTAHQYATAPTVLERFQSLLANPYASGVFHVWGHSYEFPEKNDWEGMERIYKPLSDNPDVWYCTNIELFDYEEARKRIVIAANRATAYNPSAIPVWLKASELPVWVSEGERLIEVPAGQTVSLAG